MNGFAGLSCAQSHQFRKVLLHQLCSFFEHGSPVIRGCAVPFGCKFPRVADRLLQLGHAGLPDLANRFRQPGRVDVMPCLFVFQQSAGENGVHIPGTTGKWLHFRRQTLQLGLVGQVDAA